MKPVAVSFLLTASLMAGADLCLASDERIELSHADAARANGNRLIEVRGDLVPYLRLREWFDEGGERLPSNRLWSPDSARSASASPSIRSSASTRQ